MVKTILIVDDNGDMRRRVKSFLSPEPGVRVIGEVVDGEQAVLQAAALNPDLVLMDVSLPKLDGLDATRRIKAIKPSIQVIMLSIYDLDEYKQAAVENGAAGYGVKETMGQKLLPAI